MHLRSPLRSPLVTVAATALLAGAFTALPGVETAQAHDDHAAHVLVFTKTADFRHESIPDGIAMIERLGEANNFEVVATEDAAQFTDANLAQYDAVVWLSTTGDVLNDAQQEAFERYVQNGGGYAGIHAAADTEYDWAWYGDLVGGYFTSHPEIQEATVTVQDRVHPSTQDLPLQWTRTDEWYNYATNPTGQVHVLAGLDETSYDPGADAMGYRHPISWCQDYDGGRSWYTGLGHTADSYTDPSFEQHVLGGILTVAGVADADCGATVPDNFEAVALTHDIGEPMTMDIAPDGRVFYTSRRGALQIYKPDTEQVVDAANLEVFSGLEDGLIGITFDPDFESNQWIYLHYSAPPDDSNIRRISRFTMDGDQLVLDSEVVMLEWFTQRDVCCHTAGDMAWDSQGNLYVSTGDNTNSMASDGMTPIDERPGRSAYDAQRTSGNTNDLSGKILRIRPEDDGSYTVPDGNLIHTDWAQDKDQSLIRPEIYIMGLRNPFRIWVDPKTDWLYWGNVGPDASNAIPDRGPAAYDEWDLAKEAGNYGWPYCSGPNDAYYDYDFATGESGEQFDCANGPTNDSPNNTGVMELPPAQPADIWYPRGTPPEQFPWIDEGFGNTAMGGVIYDYDDTLTDETRFPPYFDGKWFVYEWSREFFKVLTMNPETEQPVHVDDFPQADPLVRGMDMEFGPDGHLYILDYGTGYFSGSPEAGVYRIDYVGGVRSPVPEIDATPTSGQTPLEVAFDGSESTDPQGGTLTYEWDFTDDGTVDSTEGAPTHTYTEDGEHVARLTVTDPDGDTGTITTTITVGNTAPEVTVNTPVEGGFAAWGEGIPFQVEVTDAEDGSTTDGTIDCQRVEVSFITGHDVHGHPQTTVNGCDGVLPTGDPGDGHGVDADVFPIVAATYRDDAQGDIPSLTTDTTTLLQPKHRQAEHFAATGGTAGTPGVARIEHGAAEGDARIGGIHHGEWVSFNPVNFANIDSLRFRVSSGGEGGSMELRVGEPDGPLVGSVAVENTGSYDSYAYVDLPIELTSETEGTHELYLVFTNPDAGDSALFDVDAFYARGLGVADNAIPHVDEVTATPEVGQVPHEVTFEALATDPDGGDLTYTWDFGDGNTGEGASVVHTYEAAGVFTATVTVTDDAGLTDTGSVEVEAFAPADSCLRSVDTFCVIDISAYYNNDGISTAESPGDGAFDVGGNTTTYPAEELPTAGDVTLGDVPYEFPTKADGVPNNVEGRGQSLGLFPGNYGQIHLLGSAHNGNVDTTATVTYTDGSTQTIPIQFTDWAQSPAFGEDAVINTPYRYNADGQTTPPVFIFHQALALDPTREAALLTLPDNDLFHLFGVTTDTSEIMPELGLSPSSGEPYLGDDYTVTAEVETGGIPNVDEDVRFEAYRADPDAPLPPGYDEGVAHVLVDDNVVATGDDGTAQHSYTYDPADNTEANDVVVACVGASGCVDGDVLVVQDGESANISDDASAADTATVHWIESLELEEGYAWLFDGSQEMFDQWQQSGPGSFALENGVMTSQGGLGLFWQPQQSYANFNLRLQWRTEEATDNSGVFVRFPDPGDDPFVAVDEGHEIQIYDAETGEPQKTGSIYNADQADSFNSNPPGAWNDYEIEVVGREYTVTLNGEIINTYTDTQNRGLEGFVGLQNHGAGDVVSFRNVRIKELADTGPEPVLNAIGITDDDHVANGQIPGTTSFAAELLPAAGSVTPAPDDEHDDIPLRMPSDVSGEVPNMAATAGQRFELSEGEQGVYDTLHFFGSATDAGQGTVSGDFVLEFEDGSTEVVTTTYSDWGYPVDDTAEHHIAIGPMPYRHDSNGDQYAPVPFHMYHSVVPVSATSPLVAITFPTEVTATDPGGTPEEMYTLGITFEAEDGATLAANLEGAGEDDTTPPAVSVTSDPNEPDGADGWYVSPVTLAAAADDGDGSGVATVEYSVDGGDWQVYTSPVVVDEDGEHEVAVRATDVAGNVSETLTTSLKIDSTAPVLSARPTGVMSGEFEPLVSNFDAEGTATFTRADDETALDVSFTGLEPNTTYPSHVHVGTCSDIGLHYAEDPDGPAVPPNEIWPSSDPDDPNAGLTTDADGNVTGQATVPYSARLEALSVVLHGESFAMLACADLSAEGSLNIAVEAADDTSGLDSAEYRLDDGEWMAYDEPVAIDEVGEHTFAYRAADMAGNEADQSDTFTVKPLDETPPSVDVTLDPPEPNGDPIGEFEGTYNTSVTVEVATDDGPDGTGVASVEYSLDSGDWTGYDEPLVVDEPGSHTVLARATDVAGNVSDEVTVEFTIRPDECPGSDLSETVAIGDVDSGVTNYHDEGGCTVDDVIEDEDREFDNHGEAVRYVREVTNGLADDGILTKREAAFIVRAAARSDLGK